MCFKVLTLEADHSDGVMVMCVLESPTWEVDHNDEVRVICISESPFGRLWVGPVFPVSRPVSNGAEI